MQYRIQFLDAEAAVISELIADARSVHGTIAPVDDLDWPPHAVTMRVLDTDGREVHSEIKATRGGAEFRHSEIGRPSP
jgi:hypothetical protein